jgi:hypothetical protein
MSSGADLHLLYKVANAPINTYPYPHFFVQDVFPADFYAKLQSMLPDRESSMKPLPEVRAIGGDGYRERFVLVLGGEHMDTLTEEQREFWMELRGMLVGGAFGQMLLDRFNPVLKQRFGGKKVGFYDEAMLVQDTDAGRKVVTLLFYLPRDESQRNLGTSIYLPKDRQFRCPGGPHYKREDFDRMWTMPFLPNSLFVFCKTDNSFHGVEPVTDPDTRRWLLLYDIFHRVESQ